MTSAIIVEPLAERHLAGFAKLFEAASSSCFCRYWHFTGTKNDWLDRCANRPEENLAEQTDAVVRGDVSASGLVALVDGAVVGWMKLAPRESVPKLTGLPVYRQLVAEPGTWAIGCFVVDPAARRRGVARALVQGAEAHVAARGGLAIEAHPRRSTEPLHDEEAWQGPERVFVELGFTAIHDVSPYPVYRKVVSRLLT
ncbi:MAG: Acetyltransferase [Myxococcaceae bacterium]|nr:Acetyltransferase [Myxococcaceae bacterium]